MLRAQQIYAPNPPAIADAAELAIGRRLFRTLPEDSHDYGPVVAESGRWTLVADVRLDDRDELCIELGIASEQAKRLSDSALVMRAVERWGDDAIGRLIGEFALVLWDSREKRIILARDFLGLRPLHYHRGQGFFAVASMPKGLHALSCIPREPDEQSVAEFLGLFPERSNRSFFRTVERVQSGEMVIVTEHGIRRQSHWKFEPRLVDRKGGEYLEAVREALDRAVAARLRGANSEVGAQLSGGLDSSIVATAAARIMGPAGKVIAFTAAPRDGQIAVEADHFADESAHAAATAALYPNIEHVIVRSAGRSPLEDLDRNFYLYDRPVLNLCNYAWIKEILREAQSRGIRVLLNGNLGNITISYDGLESLAERLSRGRFVSALGDATLLRRTGVPLRRLGASAIGPFLPRPLWRMIRRPWNKAAGPVRSEGAALLETRAELDNFDTSYQPGRDSLVARRSGLQALDFGNYNKGFLAGWGIDVRDPTGDRRLVELCLSIPAAEFVRNGWTRSVARRAFADRLPDMVLHERRKGYQAADWHEGVAGAWPEIQQELGQISNVPQARAIIDTEGLQTLLDRRPERWEDPRVERAYRLDLLRGLSAGHFLRRATGAN